MPSFRYVARDQTARETTGTVDADSLDAARAMLQQRDLQVIELTLVASPAEAEPAALTRGESIEFARGVAQVAAGNVPLGPGLRAAADESASRRVRDALLWIARQVEQGKPIEQAVDESKEMIPGYLIALIRGASRNDCLGDALFALVEHQQSVRALLRRGLGSLTYSFTVLGIGLLILFYIVRFITGTITLDLVVDFGLRPAPPTQVLMWFQRSGMGIMLVVLLASVGLAMIFRLLRGPAAWQRFMATIPLVGQMIQWTRLADWVGLTRILLANGLTLPEALRLAGDGTRSASVGQVSYELADGVAHGRSLAELLQATHLVPASLLPIFRWGEHEGTLIEALQIGQEVLQRRVAIRARLLQAIVPPVVFVVLGCMIMFVVSASFLPLIDLISKLQ